MILRKIKVIQPRNLEAIEKYGIINEHRKSYAPVATYLRNRGEVNEENI